MKVVYIYQFNSNRKTIVSGNPIEGLTGASENIFDTHFYKWAYVKDALYIASILDSYNILESYALIDILNWKFIDANRYKLGTCYKYQKDEIAKFKSQYVFKSLKRFN